MNGDYWGINETGLLGLPFFLLCIALPLLTIGPIWNTLCVLFGRGQYYHEQTGQPFERKSSWLWWLVIGLLVIIAMCGLSWILPPT